MRGIDVVVEEGRVKVAFRPEEISPLDVMNIVNDSVERLGYSAEEEEF
jgi:hypothetical protein